MSSKTKFKDFVGQYVIDQEFDILDQKYLDDYSEDFENSIYLTLNFKDYDQLYSIRPNFRTEFFDHFYSRGWTGLVVLRIENNINNELDLEMTLKGIYEGKKINCYDITDATNLKKLDLKCLDVFQKLTIFLDSLNVYHHNGGNELIIYLQDHIYTLVRNKDKIHIMDDAMNVHNFQQNTLEEIKSYLFPELVREENLRTLIN
tara:strand:+ start:92801 stop:93409 length:609 start_codon:yes stop_codon:yes gene_type:complete